MASTSEGKRAIEVIEAGRALTAGTVEGFQRRVREALEKGHRHLLVDMSGTESVDSTGLGALVRLQRQTNDLGGRLALVQLRENSQILLKLTQLDTVLETFADAAQAADGFARPRPEPQPTAEAETEGEGDGA